MERQYVPKTEIATVFRKDIARLVSDIPVRFVRQRMERQHVLKMALVPVFQADIVRLVMILNANTARQRKERHCVRLHMDLVSVRQVDMVRCVIMRAVLAVQVAKRRVVMESGVNVPVARVHDLKNIPRHLAGVFF